MLVDNVVRANAGMTAAQLLSCSPLLNQSVTDKQVKIVAAFYDFNTGAVKLLT